MYTRQKIKNLEKGSNAITYTSKRQCIVADTLKAHTDIWQIAYETVDSYSKERKYQLQLDKHKRESIKKKKIWQWCR